MPLLAVALLVSLLFFSGFAIAAVDYPPCKGTTLSWAYNSLGQNPCAVRAFTMTTCSGDSYSIDPIEPGDHYIGPSADDPNLVCKCNTVGYSLISACGACQGGDWITWSEYVTNCTKILPPSSFPHPIPTGTRLPRWALLDVTNENNWNPDKSYAAGDTPELGPGTIPGPSSVPTSTYPSASSSSSSSSSVSQSSSSISATPTHIDGHSSNAGAIAGGVTGSIASVSILIAALLFYLRRRRPAAPPAPSAPSSSPITDGQLGGFSPNISQVSPRSVSGRETVASSVPETTTSLLMRPYNPDDPATYPTHQGASPPPTYNPIQTPSPMSSRNIYTVATESHSQGQGIGYNGLPIV